MNRVASSTRKSTETMYVIRTNQIINVNGGGGGNGLSYQGQLGRVQQRKNDIDLLSALYSCFNHHIRTNQPLVLLELVSLLYECEN